MRHLILTISIIGIIIHLTLLTVLNLGTILVIEKTSEFIRYEINKNLSQKITKIKSNKTFKAAKLLLGNHVDNIDLKVDSVEATIKDEILHLTEELKVAKGKIEIPTTESFEITKILTDRAHMQNWLRYKYLNTLKELKFELNIFITTNLIIFLMLFIVNIKKEQPEIVKILSILSIIAVILSSLLYIFAQNWFYAIILNAYFGYSYSLIIIIILGVLADITFNKGRILGKIGLP